MSKKEDVMVTVYKGGKKTVMKKSELKKAGNGNKSKDKS